jgi:predicted short-subunit dehydrogenase-like oxidoreductase (DUF2520 family)
MYKDVVSFAGAGRVGTALSRALFEAGFRMDLIVSPSEAGGKALAAQCNAVWSSELTFPDSTSVIIVAVPDHKLIEILKNIRCRQSTLVVHTAGSFGLDIFPEYITEKGVFYPLQTFSKDRKINFSDLPFLLESSSVKSSALLSKMAGSLSSKVYFFNSEQRRMIHLSAVFVCNFTNHLLSCGKDISLKGDFPFEILYPVITETVLKAIDSGPENSQTGPAIRNDTNTIEKHLELLSFSPQLQRIYKEMTLSIIEYHKRIING